MNALMISILVTLGVVAIAVIVIAVEVCKCRRLLTDIQQKGLPFSNTAHGPSWSYACQLHEPPPHGYLGRGGCFIIWEWRDGRWSLMHDQPTGNAAEEPPAFSGSFDGDLAKTWVTNPS